MNRKKTIIFISILISLSIITSFTACSFRGKDTKSPGTNPGTDIQLQHETTPLVFERTSKKNVYLEGENVGGLKESEILRTIRNNSAKVNINEKNAILDEEKWVVLESEKPGLRVNEQKTLEAVLNANEGINVEVVVEEVQPALTSKMLQGNIVEIGGYTTTLIDRQPSRINNIELAAEKINGKKIMPGEEFSFNRIVGKRTEAKGYEEAPIIIKTKEGPKKDYGFGGGICQLSSTIFNAVEMGGLEVTERHEHSKDVGYVPEGKDATVSYGSIDFKFRNNRQYPIMVKVYLSSREVSVRIFENRN